MTSRINSELCRAISAYAQQNTQQARAKIVDTPAGAGLPADKVDLSPLARELAKDLALASRIIRETDVTFPAVGDSSAKAYGHRAKIEDLAYRISQGTYQPPLRELAERLAPALRALDDISHENPVTSS